MARGKRMSARQQVKLGREIQEQYDHGASWDEIATDVDMSKSRAQKLARTYREDCDRRAHQHQLPLFS